MDAKNKEEKKLLINYLDLDLGISFILCTYYNYFELFCLYQIFYFFKFLFNKYFVLLVLICFYF